MLSINHFGKRHEYQQYFNIMAYYFKVYVYVIFWIIKSTDILAKIENMFK